MPYVRTGREPGRPAKPRTVPELEASAAKLRESAHKREAAADAGIAKMLASGKTRQQVADEIGKTLNHVRVAKRRHERRVMRQEASRA